MDTVTAPSGPAVDLANFAAGMAAPMVVSFDGQPRAVRYIDRGDVLCAGCFADQWDGNSPATFELSERACVSCEED